MTRENNIFRIVVFLAVLISVVSYETYFKFGWYNLDDYFTLEFVPSGTSFLESCKEITKAMYAAQGRFQPVRLSVFEAFARYFDESSSVYYNFALHAVNMVLMFMFLRKFRMDCVFSLFGVLMFSVFGRFRFMDSSSVMIGGSGLNLFFILLTLLFLIKTLETTRQEPFKRYSFLLVSSVAYACLVFSYEVALPLFLTIPATLFFFLPEDKKTLKEKLRSREVLYLVLYLAPVLIYYLMYHKPSHYSGAQMSLDLSSSYIRLEYYLHYTVLPKIRFFRGFGIEEIAVLLLYFTAVTLAFRTWKDPAASKQKMLGVRLLILSLIFYFSTVVIFLVNSSEPKKMLIHHTYLMTAGSSVMVASLFYCAQWLIPGFLKKIYLFVLAVFIFPLVLLSGVSFNISHYAKDSIRTDRIKSLKKSLQSNIPDIEKTDAIILKNFFYEDNEYYKISGMNGAFLKWFGFRKDINSGREVISAKGGIVRFMGPLHRYKTPEEMTVRNDRLKIFYVNDAGAALPYSDFINFRESKNLYQTEQVKGDCFKKNCDDDRTLEAILANFNRNAALSIAFQTRRDATAFLDNLASIELNEERVPRHRISVADNEITINTADTTKDNNYYFLKIVSNDRSFKRSLVSLRLHGR